MDTEISLHPDFREFIQLLNAHDVQYLAVGGFAVAFHGYPPARIDLLTTLPGVDFEECFQSRVETQVGDTLVNFIDLENLKRNKRASGRPQDLADLAYLA